MGSAPSRAELKTRHGDKTAKERTKLRNRVTAYRLVDIRDGYRCRVCGGPSTQHHHIRGRVGKFAETTANIMCICDADHDLRHVKRTLTITGNADSTLTFDDGTRVWHG